MNDNDIRTICEMMDGGSFVGGITAQVPQTLATINQTPFPVSTFDNEPSEGEYCEEELQLAKRFIELVGDGDRAKELVAKVLDCEDCLGIIDDEMKTSQDISDIADQTPESMDLPTGLYRQFS